MSYASREGKANTTKWRLFCCDVPRSRTSHANSRGNSVLHRYELETLIFVWIVSASNKDRPRDGSNIIDIEIVPEEANVTTRTKQSGHYYHTALAW